MSLLFKKIMGCLVGGAIGDAMGAPVEGCPAEQIASKFGRIEGFVVNEERPGSKPGVYTDDTYIKNWLCQAYIDKKRHLTADEFAEYWRDKLDVNRIWWAEKYGWYRVKYGNVDPRISGVGNLCNCGAAMYISPVGIINACDPEAAYREALLVAAINQWSFGLEAAAVLAAGVAEAFRPDASAESVVETAIALAKGGTKLALEAVIEVAKRYNDVYEAINPLREAVKPFDTAEAEANHHIPSHLHSIEEVPIAFAMFFIARGDPSKSIAGGVNYGRDCDSIGGMAGALAGALKGVNEIPVELVNQVQEANDYDAKSQAEGMYKVLLKLMEENRQRLRELEQLKG